jgi:DNA-binding beta-propeller fold protein YncE
MLTRLSSGRWLPKLLVVGFCGWLAAMHGCSRQNASGDAAELGQVAQAPAYQAPQSAVQEGAAAPLKYPFENHAPAPSLEGGTEWLNTSAPIDLKSLHGKFVLLDFWTYCCINCMHVLPELHKLEKAYPNNIVVIGVHSGKYDAEHDSENIRQAILRYDIDHPVVNDADYKIWNRYHCDSWPSLRLIDPEGNLVAEQDGEIEFATLNAFFQKVLPYYRQNKLLDERPVHFALERDKAANTPLSYPGKILADEAGNRLFIADSGHNRIVVASLDGKLQSVIGSGQIGRSDGDFHTAQFHHPQGMALSGDVLYVADTENHLLRKIDLTGQRVSTIAGTGQEAQLGAAAVEPETPLATAPSTEHSTRSTLLSTALNSPWALCIQDHNLYIAMAGDHQIWKMPLDESEIGPYSGNGREDIVDGPLLGNRPFETGFASFAQPSGLSTDGASLYVADSEGSSIREVPLKPMHEVHTILGTADLGLARLFTFGDEDGPVAKAHLQHCMDVAYHDDRLYVADTYNDKIKVINLKTHECHTLAGAEKAGQSNSNLASTGGAAKRTSLYEPTGLSYAGGKLYVADTNNQRIRVIELTDGGDTAAQITTLPIVGLTAPSSPPPPALAAPRPGAQQQRR